MRIRNSRTSFPIPQVPQAVLRSTHFRSQFQHFDEQFLVEEENQRIGWPYYPVSQKLEEPDKEGRTSNSSATSKRNVKGPRFSASVVIALPAPCTQPARGKKVYRKQKELPLKKRNKCRKLEIERTQAEKEEAATVKQDRTKEAFNKHDTSQVRTCINCVLNCESSLPHSRTYGSHGLQKEEDELVETATLHAEKPNRKRGRPRKDSVHQSTATFGASPF